MAQHCPECGFSNADGANYCQRCGAFLGGSEQSSGDTTAAYKIGETGEIEEIDLEAVAARGAALVIRAGGGRAGESFPLQGERMTVVVHRGHDYYLDDCGSLNGTYVNRKRIESHRLADGDELQVGKYKLAFLSR